MASADFQYLINFIGPNIAKKDATYRAAGPVEKTFAVTLLFSGYGRFVHQPAKHF
jgi:hypothetical protein